jgi:NADH-quinone oxidoreductase subunit H
MEPLVRLKTEYKGISKTIVDIVVPIGRALGPILKRLAWPIFVAAVLALIVFVWLVAKLVDPVHIWLVHVPWIVTDIAGVLGTLGFICLLAIVCIWGERKVAGHIQSRIGPMRTGGWHGWAQSPADGLKLVAKEDTIPTSADRPMFRLAPYLALVPAICAYTMIPFGFAWVFRDSDVSLLIVLGFLGVEVLGVILAGWASNNKWSLFGGMREACQLVSYEIPMGLSLLTAVAVAGTLRLTELGQMQSGGWFGWLMFKNPFMFVAFFTYFVASLASCNRTPFDLPEGESELVAGFHTEYSGFRFAMFFFGEYAAMFVVSALATIVFLGGWNSPFGTQADSGPLWFIGKCSFLIFIQMWIRWTLPRIRLDQVMHACVKYLLPMTMVVFLGGSLWQLYDNPAYPAFLSAAGVIRVILALLGLVILGQFLWLAGYGWINRIRMVGRLGRRLMPGA